MVLIPDFLYNNKSELQLLPQFLSLCKELTKIIYGLLKPIEMLRSVSKLLIPRSLKSHSVARSKKSNVKLCMEACHQGGSLK